MRTNRILAVLATVSVVLSLRGQNQSKGTLSTTTRLVTISLVVRDAQGNPIRDLKQDEVSVLDDGKPQQIRFFNLLEDKAPALPLQHPNAFSNEDIAGKAPNNITIIFFDTLNTRWTSQGYSLDRVRNFLRQLHPEDHVGLYVLGGEKEGLRVIHDFSEDSSALIAGIHRYDERKQGGAATDGKSAESTGSEELDSFLMGRYTQWRSEIEHPFAAAAAGNRLQANMEITIAALETICRHLEAVPGRKSLVWITDSYFGSFLADNSVWWAEQEARRFPSASRATPPPTPGEMPKESPEIAENVWVASSIERVSRLFGDASIAVYPVSAEGLLGFSPTPRRDPTAQEAFPNHGPMLELAQRTGGRAFYDRNDLETGVRQALDDAQFAYAVAYYPEHKNWKGEWRKIQVKVNRAGVKVLARQGYFAMPEPGPEPPQFRKREMEEAAVMPLNATGVPVWVEAQRHTKDNKPYLQVRVHFAAARLLSMEENQNWKSSLDTLFVQVDPSGKVLDATNESIDMEIKAENYQRVARNGASFSADLALLPGVKSFSVVLRDKGSDAMGSVQFALAALPGTP